MRSDDVRQSLQWNMRSDPVRAALVALIGLALLAAAVAVLTGLFLIVVLVVGLAVLNLIYLPRIAARVRLPVGWVAMILIPFMILAGEVIAGPEGVAWSVVVWLVAIGVPRAIGQDLLRRLRRELQDRGIQFYDVPARRVDAQDSTTRTTDPAGLPSPPVDGRGRGGSGL
jgi:hypothetical protein